MGYVEHNLNPGERVIYTTRLHWVVLVRSMSVDLIFSILGFALIGWALGGKLSDHREAQASGYCGLALIIVGNALLILASLRRNATEMAVTNKRVIINVGLLTKRTIELFLAKVESVEVEQTISGRVLGFGSVTVRGTGGTYEPFRHVANPLEFRRQVQYQIEGQLKPPS